MFRPSRDVEKSFCRENNGFAKMDGFNSEQSFCRQELDPTKDWAARFLES